MSRRTAIGRQQMRQQMRGPIANKVDPVRRWSRAGVVEPLANQTADVGRAIPT